MFPCLEILLVHEIQTGTLIKTLLLSHLGEERLMETESRHSMPPPLPTQGEPTTQGGRKWIFSFFFYLKGISVLSLGEGMPSHSNPSFLTESAVFFCLKRTS